MGLGITGILMEEYHVQQQFSQQITFSKGRYKVHLPWKQFHPHPPDNYDLCKRQLSDVLKRLTQNPEQLRCYDSVVQGQLQKGVVKIVQEPANYKSGRLHYLPQHGVFQHNKQTTRLKVVYDASAKTDGPSLNDCLHTGPNYEENIMNIFL